MVFPRLFLTAALLAAAGPLTAQVVFQPLAISDADALAEQVRRLGSNPLDLGALLNAGELSLRLDDLNAAGAFFSRAERIDPRNPRAKAGEGALLVRSERPGEALRLFAQAEAMGLAPARFAADRGLAYDLVGDQGRAQRDYRQALSARADDETRRRYALSLAISGKQAQALDLLAPLIRQNDRAAWRSRAFILAMGGNGAEASRIAQTMMPPGSATGLQGFFTELPRLSAIDRAFAVHFGEVHPTAARLADARLAPAVVPLPAEAAQVQVAAVTPQAERGRDRRKDRRAPVVLAAAVPPPAVEVAAQPPVYQPRTDVRAVFAPANDRPLTSGELASLNAAGLRAPPRTAARPLPAPTPGFSSLAASRAPTPTEQANRAVAVIAPSPRGASAMVQPVPSIVVAAVAQPMVSRPPVLAEAVTAPVRAGDVGIATSLPVVTAPAMTLASAVPPAALAVTTPLASSPAPMTPAGMAPASRTASVAPAAPLEVVSVGAAPLVPSAGTIMADPVSSEGAVPPVQVAAIDVETPPAPIMSSASPAEVTSIPALPATPAPSSALPRLAPTRTARSPRLGRAEADSILARIVANLAIPASELDVDGPPAPGARPQTPAERRRARSADPVGDKPTAADRKLLAVRKAAADKKALADKAAAKEVADARKASRAQPGRIWVQVAGGANEGDLDKAWSSVRTKAPTAFAGRQAWTTPLRATNRVLTGPFKSDAEARAYVNNLAKSGVSAFTFTSEAGQKVSRLPGK